MRFTARMPMSSTASIRLSQVVACVLVVLGTAPVVGASAEPMQRTNASDRAAACPAVSTDPADFPRAVPMPQGEHEVRGYLRADCRHILDLALDTEDLAPERRHLVRRLRAVGFHGVVSTSRTVEVDIGPDSEPEQRGEFTVRASGRGLRVAIELSFVGAAPRWGGTALIRYVVRPQR